MRGLAWQQPKGRRRGTWSSWGLALIFVFPLQAISSLPPHIESKSWNPAVQHRLHRAERCTDRIVRRQDGGGVQHVEDIELSGHLHAAELEVLLQIDVQLIVTRQVERARRVEDDGLDVGPPAREQAGRWCPRDHPGEPRVAL